LILSGGFDGRVALSDASSNGRGSVWSCENAHADKVTAARFDARGAGFVSCGVDRVVKAWALRDEIRDRS
jgi:WD40 repeat protein